MAVGGQSQVVEVFFRSILQEETTCQYFGMSPGAAGSANAGLVPVRADRVRTIEVGLSKLARRTRRTFVSRQVVSEPHIRDFSQEELQQGKAAESGFGRSEKELMSEIQSFCRLSHVISGS